MEKKKYISDEEHEKCRRVAEAFAELEDVDIVVVDVGRYGFVKLQYYTPPTGFENDFTFTDSKELFEDLYEEWLHTQLIALAGEMNVSDIEYDDIYRRLTEEQHRKLEEQKKVFAQKAGIVLQ
ncbi:MAG: hypothetical protein K1W41_23315 [Lachnospiraceae bacterium]